MGSPSLNKAVVYAIIIATSVILSETAIMLLLPGISGGKASVSSVVIDVLLISGVLAPLMYYLLYRPLTRSYEDKERARIESLKTLSLMTKMTQAVPGFGREDVYKEVIRSVVDLARGKFGFIAEFNLCEDGSVGINMLSVSFVQRYCGDDMDRKMDSRGCLGPSAAVMLDALKEGAAVELSRVDLAGYGLKHLAELQCISSLRLIPLMGIGGPAELLGFVGLGFGPEGMEEDRATYIEPIIGSCTNLVEIRRKAELIDEAHKRMRESEELFRSLVETSSDWIWELDTEYRFVYSSPNVEFITGRGPEEVVGRTPFELMPAETATAMKELFVKHAAGMTSFSMARSSYKRPDGEEVITESSGTPVSNPDGAFMGFRGIDRDVTARVRLEREKREFLSMLTHDIASPLTGASTMIETLLLVDGNVRENPALTKRLGVVLDSLKKPLTLIDNMSYFIKNGTHRHTLKPTGTELVGFVKAKAGYFQSMAEKNGLKLSVSSPYMDMVCKLDQELVERALNNLIANAIKYTPSGGRVSVDIAHTDTEVVVEVRDDGLGIPEEEQSAIFDRFRRSSLTKHINGSGLGLSIVKEVAELHGGTVELRSEPGRGSVFTLRLPQPEPPSYNMAIPEKPGERKEPTVN